MKCLGSSGFPMLPFSFHGAQQGFERESAADEQEVTTAVRRISGSKEHMVILIAHRLSTSFMPTLSMFWKKDGSPSPGRTIRCSKRKACTTPCGGSRSVRGIRNSSGPLTGILLANSGRCLRSHERITLVQYSHSGRFQEKRDFGGKL